MYDNNRFPDTDTLHDPADDYPMLPLEPTPLDPLETSGISNDGLAETFRHSGWAKLRKKVYAALEATGQKWGRLCSFRTCGSDCYILQNKADPTVIRLAASCCHDRFCLPCGQTRSRTIAANVQPYLKKAQTRFITLTLKQNDLPLGHNIERLYDGFKKLRKSSLWKLSQKGGAAFLEIKRSRDRDHWHPHLHIVSTGKFIDGQKLSNAWRHITTDSYITDVRLVRDDTAVLDYVTKYASKPFDPSLYDNQAVLEEAIVALAGKRMCITYGNWKGLQMTTKPEADQWEFLDTLEGLCVRAAQGDVFAERIVKNACGDKADRLIERAARDVVPRMNLTRPPTPDVQLYLLEPATTSRSCYP